MRILNLSLLLMTAILSLSCGKTEKSTLPDENNRSEEPRKVTSPSPTAPAAENGRALSSCPATLSERWGETCAEQGIVERSLNGLYYQLGQAKPELQAVGLGHWYSFNPDGIFESSFGSNVQHFTFLISNWDCDRPDDLILEIEGIYRARGDAIKGPLMGKGKLSWKRVDAIGGNSSAHYYVFEKNPETKTCAVVEFLVYTKSGEPGPYPDTGFEKNLINSMHY